MRLLKFIIFLVLMTSVTSAFSQSSSALKKSKDMINKEIEQLKKAEIKLIKAKNYR